MGGIPGAIDIFNKILSECGLLSCCLAFAVVFLGILALQLAKIRAVSEADRVSYYKLYNEQIVTQREMAVAQAKLEGLVFALQRSDGHHDS